MIDRVLLEKVIKMCGYFMKLKYKIWFRVVFLSGRLLFGILLGNCLVVIELYL